jgi:hypothetical protein
MANPTTEPKRPNTTAANCDHDRHQQGERNAIRKLDILDHGRGREHPDQPGV